MLPNRQEVKIVADSVNTAGCRLLSFELLYHRFIHSEMMTHCMLSRNAASSRAIPTSKLIQMVEDDPWMPIHWGQNEPGMRAREELHPVLAAASQNDWRYAAAEAAKRARKMMERGTHKQVVNRLLEPFLPIRVLFSGTEWGNFFWLRDDEDAMPEIQALAVKMKEAAAESIPRLLKPTKFHLPYILEDEEDEFNNETVLKISAARCARLSYRLLDGSPTTVEKDLELYKKLMGSERKHASPTEHQAAAMDNTLLSYHSGKFRGFIQHRKLIDHENHPTELYTGPTR